MRMQSYYKLRVRMGWTAELARRYINVSAMDRRGHRASAHALCPGAVPVARDDSAAGDKPSDVEVRLHANVWS